jgi:hypothetical protein
MLKQTLTSQLGKKMTRRFSMILASLLLAAATVVAGANLISINSSIKHFGDEPNSLGGQGTFVGDDFDYTFNAPGVNPNKAALLTLRAFGVSVDGNVVQINGHTITRALISHEVSGNEWFSEHVRVPAGVLKETGNVLRISARNASGGQGGNLDDFLVDDLMLIYELK